MDYSSKGGLLQEISSKNELKSAILWEAFFHSLENERFYPGKIVDKFNVSKSTAKYHFDNMLGEELLCKENPRARKKGKKWVMKPSFKEEFKSSFENWRKKYRVLMYKISKFDDCSIAMNWVLNMLRLSGRTLSELKEKMKETIFQGLENPFFENPNHEVERYIEFVLRLFASNIELEYDGRKRKFVYKLKETESLPLMTSNEWKVEVDGEKVNQPLLFGFGKDNLKIKIPFPEESFSMKGGVFKRSMGFLPRLDFAWVQVRGEDGEIKMPPICRKCRDSVLKEGKNLVEEATMEIGKKEYDLNVSEKHSADRYGSCKIEVIKHLAKFNNPHEERKTFIFLECPEGRRDFWLNKELFIPTSFSHLD